MLGGSRGPGSGGQGGKQTSHDKVHKSACRLVTSSKGTCNSSLGDYLPIQKEGIMKRNYFVV